MSDAADTLPWLDEPLTRLLAMRAHALLVHASPGVGSLQLAARAARAWLCENESSAARPCDRCPACQAASARSHPDLRWLVSEEWRQRLGWQGGEVEEAESGTRSPRKPSRQIRIDDVREAIDWLASTSSRGRGKVMVIHAAEALNPAAASALLKTLEEPAAGVHILLTAAEPARLLPTVLSRCQRLRVPPPPPAEAAAWLAARGVAGAEVLLAACAGAPLEALAWSEGGVAAAAWAALPGEIARGRPGVLASWPVPRVIDALLKLCHDALARSLGGDTTGPRFFPAASLPAGGNPEALAAWARSLWRQAATAEHPYSEPLLLDALLLAGRRALAAPAARGGPAATLRP